MHDFCFPGNSTEYFASEPFKINETAKMCVSAHRANQKQWHDICLTVQASHCGKSMPVMNCGNNRLIEVR
jgi:hypothetical protein